MPGLKFCLKVFVVSLQRDIVHVTVAKFFKFTPQLIHITLFLFLDAFFFYMSKCFFFLSPVLEFLVQVHASGGGLFIATSLRHGLKPQLSDKFGTD